MDAKKSARVCLALVTFGLPLGWNASTARAAQPTAVGSLIDTLGDPKADTLSRIEATRKMAQAGDAKYLPRLTQALKDDNKAVRWAAVEALWDLGDPRAVPDLIEFLGKGEGYDWGKVLALNALGAMKDAQAVPPLIRMLDNENPFLRRSAALALVRIGDERAIPALIRLLKDDEGWLRRLAHLLLLEITDGKIHGDPPRGYEGWSQWAQGQAQRLKVEGIK